MKVFTQLVSVCMLSAAAAFVPTTPTLAPSTALNSLSEAPSGHIELFPEEFNNSERIEGGSTVRTYSIPPWATRIQYKFSSGGRPMRGEANLWLGPLRKTHTLKFDTENGRELPIQGTLKFKKGPPTLKVSTSSDPNCPLDFSMYVPDPDRAKQLEGITEGIHHSSSPPEKQHIQGSGVDGKNGMWVYWHIPAEVKSIQVVGWSVDTGKKSFKCDLELLKGPNNRMQTLFLQCGGGSQPYHAVYQTPGPGWTLRVRNKKFVEDGKVELTVLPYEYETNQGYNSDNGNQGGYGNNFQSPQSFGGNNGSYGSAWDSWDSRM